MNKKEGKEEKGFENGVVDGENATEKKDGENGGTPTSSQYWELGKDNKGEGDVSEISEKEIEESGKEVEEEEEKRYNEEERKKKLQILHVTARDLGWNKDKYRDWLKENYKGITTATVLDDGALDDAVKRIQNTQEERKLTAIKKHICLKCEKDVSDDVFDYSMRNYGIPLCRDDQPKPKEERKEERDITNNIGAKNLKWIYDELDPDVIQLFGLTGTLKSKFCEWVYATGKAQGLKVKFIDTERNIHRRQKQVFGTDYIYKSSVDELFRFVEHGFDADIVIVDSIGYPVLAKFARMNLRERGNALLMMIAILDALKQWANNTGGFALVTNQPISELSGLEDEDRRPFGDKAQFACKEIIRTELISNENGITKVALKMFRSRSFAKEHKIAELIYNGKMRVMVNAQ